MRIWDIVKAAQMASLLEVTSYPKPGNVHRMADFEDLKFEEFLACGIALGQSIFEACESARAGRFKTGYFMRKAILESKKWSPRNANLGIILLFFPLAQAASVSDFSDLREKLKYLCENTDMEDALMVCDGIIEASPSGMGHTYEYDVTTKEGKRQIVKEKRTLLNLFQYSSDWDSISREWAQGFPITFDVGFPSLKKYLSEHGDMNSAIIMTFLGILSQYPDTLIARKMGKRKSEEISQMALSILNEYSEEGMWEFDAVLREDRRLNPGTTADLTASSLFVLFLEKLEKTF